LKPETGPGREAVAFGMDKINGNRATMDNLSDLLSGVLRTPLVDQTGLTEKYTFELKVPQSTSPDISPVKKSTDSSAGKAKKRFSENAFFRCPLF